jgi:hypothetical protein
MNQNYAIAIGATALAGRQIVKLINDVCQIIQKGSRKRSAGKKGQQNYEAGAVSIEKRTTQAAKILKQVEVAAKGTTKAFSKIKELI